MRCSKSIETKEMELCFDCRHKTSHYISGRAVWSYNHSMAQSIARFKYKNKQEYAAFYGKEIARLYGKWIKDMGIQALIPVPIHKSKLRIRGYNQAELIAKEISINMGNLAVSKGLTRIKETIPQKDLVSWERLKNMESAFDGNKVLLNGLKKVALVDDIYTTGSTVEACTKVLLRFGIEEVYFLCVCIGVNN